MNEHLYYRCANNHPGPDHPRVRWRAEDLEQAVVDDLARLRMPSEEIRSWFRDALAAAFGDLRQHQASQSASLKKRRTELANMKDRLLNAYLTGVVPEEAFQTKTHELSADERSVDESLARLTERDAGRSEAALAVFDWTQRAADVWRGSNHEVRREILDAVCLNRTLSDVSLVTTKRKPFDVLAEGLVFEKSRGDRI